MWSCRRPVVFHAVQLIRVHTVIYIVYGHPLVQGGNGNMLFDGKFDLPRVSEMIHIHITLMVFCIILHRL